MKMTLNRISLVALLALVLVPRARGDEAAAVSNDVLSISPVVTYVNVDGDEKRFRQDWWIKDEVTGGIDELTVDRKLNDKWSLHLHGRAIFDVDDYDVQLEIVNPEKGFLRAGYTEYRKYFDDSGGYYPLFTIPTLDLGTDLHLDISRIWVELGLTLPNFPQVVLGYERKMKDGAKSMIEWGSTTGTTNGVSTATRKIFPASKDIDETVDIFKVEIDHDISNVHIGNQFRYEKYDVDSTRLDDGSFTFGGPLETNRTVTARETYEHDAFFNTFHMESHVSERVYWSMGYLFVDQRGNSAIDIDTFNGLGQLLTVANGMATGRDRDQQTLFVDLDQNSHVFNGNAMFGPFFKKSTYFYGGIQVEKTETDARGAAELFEGTSSPTEAGEFTSNNDKDWFQERIGVRFVGIPFTTLYAEAKFDQGNIALYEQEILTGVDPAIASETTDRYTDTDINRRDYRIGFSTAPIRHVTLSGYYRHNGRVNNYNHFIDQLTELGTNGVAEVTPAEGYSAFIDQQKLTTDEVGAKITIRPSSKLVVSLKYQMVATDIDTQFETAGAGGQSGDYNANIYSVSATVMPVSRLYVTGLFSYYDTRTIANDNGSLAIETYEGDVLSVVASIGYALGEKTDLRCDYSYSMADNQQANLLTGLPLGTDYQRHGVLLTLSHKLRDNIDARLRYGFYDLQDDATGGLNDYTAHLVSASCTLRY